MEELFKSVNRLKNYKLKAEAPDFLENPDFSFNFVANCHFFNYENCKTKQCGIGYRHSGAPLSCDVGKGKISEKHPNSHSGDEGIVPAYCCYPAIYQRTG